MNFVDQRTPEVDRRRDPEGWRKPCFAAAFMIAAFLAIEHDMKYAGERISDFDNGLKRDALAAGTQYQSLLRNGALLGLFAGGLVLVYKNRQRDWNPNWILATIGGGMVVWILFGALGAKDGVYVMRRLVAASCVGSFAVGYARWLRPAEIARTAFLAFGPLIVMSLLIDVAAGGNPLRGDYRFAGTLHPNSQGIYCAIFCMASLCLMKLEPKHRWPLAFCALAALVLLSATKSRGSLLGIAPALTVMWLASHQRSIRKLAWCLFAVAIAGVSLFFGCIDNGTSRQFKEAVLMGRTEDVGNLTGRVPLWDELVHVYSPKHPWKGYGYGGFWTVDRIEELFQSQKWVVPHAHNAFIDLLLQTGVVGLVGGIALLLALLFSTTGYLDRTQNPGYQFIVGLLIFAIFNSLIESLFTLPTLMATTMTLMCVASATLFKPAVGEGFNFARRSTDRADSPSLLPLANWPPRWLQLT